MSTIPIQPPRNFTPWVVAVCVAAVSIALTPIIPRSAELASLAIIAIVLFHCTSTRRLAIGFDRAAVVVVRANGAVVWEGAPSSIVRFEPVTVQGAPTLWTAVRYGIAVRTREGPHVFLVVGLTEADALVAATALNGELAATRSLTVAAPGGAAGEQGLGRCD